MLIRKYFKWTEVLSVWPGRTISRILFGRKFSFQLIVISESDNFRKFFSYRSLSLAIAWWTINFLFPTKPNQNFKKVIKKGKSVFEWEEGVINLDNIPKRVLSLVYWKPVMEILDFYKRFSLKTEKLNPASSNFLKENSNPILFILFILYICSFSSYTWVHDKRIV